LKWENIAAKCSSARQVTRTGQEVRDKWPSMKSHSKEDIIGLVQATFCFL